MRAVMVSPRPREGRNLSAPRARRNPGAPRRGTASHALATLAALACAAALAGCPSAPRPTLEVVPARALAAWDVAGLALLPSAAAAPPPTQAAPAFTAEAEPGRDPTAVGARPAGASWSLGTTSRGSLLGGARLPEDSPALAVRATTRARGADWGTADFVAAVVRAARHVADRYPGSRLHLGDLALEHGGNFAPHRSHASGRDLDLAFYLMDARGAPDDGPEMRWVDADGRVSGTELRFDAARNWALVEALLRDPAAQVQWVFVAAHLEPLLIAAGRASGASAELLERAAAVLQQPGDSSPHADHFHIRVYCGEAERLEGCLDAPPFHAWVDRHEAAVARWVEGLVPFLDDPRGAAGEEFRFAVERLVRANATAALPALEARAARPLDASTRSLLADAIDFLSGRRTPEAWARFRPEDVGD